MNNVQWAMDNGQWAMDNGQWTMDNERCTRYDATGVCIKRASAFQ